MTATIALPWLSIQEAAKQANTTAEVLRIWETRYGWPHPRRTRHGVRQYAPADIHVIRRLVALSAAGVSLRTIIVDGRPRLPDEHKPTQLIHHLNFGDVAGPDIDQREAWNVRDRLVCGLVQRHPGIVLWAVAACVTLRPADRGPAVLNILDAYRKQVADTAWLDRALGV